MAGGTPFIVSFDAHPNQRGLDVELSRNISPGTWELWNRFKRVNKLRVRKPTRKVVYRWRRRQLWLAYIPKRNFSLVNFKRGVRISER